MSRPKLAVASDVATVVLALAAIGVFGFRFVRTQRPPSGPVVELSSANLHAIMETGGIVGSSAPTVKVAVFSDYQCPFCKIADASLRRILAEHPNDLAIVVRHMPLESIHPKAVLAASAADCAGQQGRFASMHEALFDHQGELSSADAAWFTQLAGSIGVIEADAFKSCLGSEASIARIRADQQLGTRLGVTGTPAFIVDTKLVIGAPDEAGLRALVEKEIAQAN